MMQWKLEGVATILPWTTAGMELIESWKERDNDMYTITVNKRHMLPPICIVAGNVVFVAYTVVASYFS